MMRTSLALAIAGAALMAPAMGLAATAADKAAATRASAWLAGEAPSGLPAGQQADVMVAMRLTGTPAPALRARMRAMAAAAPAYADTAGATAKVVLGAVAAGGNPSALGGVDYLARLSAQSTGAGRYGRNAFDQGLAMIALRAATGKVPAAIRTSSSRTTLLAAKSGPGWNLDLNATGAPGVDSTALAVVALRAGGQSCASAPIREARAWLAAQRANGGWTAYPGSPPSANSTALVARADIACGAPARGALALLRSLQQRSGAIRFTRAQPESRLLATSESVAPLAGVSLARGLRPG